MTTPPTETGAAAMPALDPAQDAVADLSVSDAVAVMGALPLRERVEALRLAAQELFAHVNVPVVDWGDDTDVEPAHEAVTVDEELAGLQAERCALVEVIADVVAVTRSLDASVRVLADQHARVVSRVSSRISSQKTR